MYSKIDLSKNKHKNKNNERFVRIKKFLVILHCFLLISKT